VVVFHVPNEKAAAAYSATVRIESHVAHQIVDMGTAEDSLELAKELQAGYQPPGAGELWRQEYDAMG